MEYKMVKSEEKYDKQKQSDFRKSAEKQKSTTKSMAHFIHIKRLKRQLDTKRK